MYKYSYQVNDLSIFEILLFNSTYIAHCREIVPTAEITKEEEMKEVKFIHFEKATKFCEISTFLLSYVVPVKSMGKISQNFVAFSKCMKLAKTWQQA